MWTFNKYIVIVAMLLLSTNLVTAQSADSVQFCLPSRMIPTEELPFKATERLTYVLNYKWGPRLDVGEATITLSEGKTRNGRKTFHAIAHGKTYRFWDMFFKVRDLYESQFYADNMKSFYFHRDVKEGGYEIKNFFYWNDENHDINARIELKNRPARDTIMKGRECTHDLLALFYFARTINFEEIKENTRYPISFVIDEEVYDMSFAYLGKEEKKIPVFGKCKTMKFAVKLVAGEVFTGKEDMIVWVTDDENKVPLLFESPILVGSIQGRLDSYKNLKHPISAVVK